MAQSGESAPGWHQEGGRRLYVARQQEIEWLDLIDVFLSFVELFKGTHNGGAGNRRTTD